MMYLLTIIIIALKQVYAYIYAEIIMLYQFNDTL